MRVEGLGFRVIKGRLGVGGGREGGLGFRVMQGREGGRGGGGLGFRVKALGYIAVGEMGWRSGV